MSYLRKYAKPRAATKKKQYGTRLTEDEGKEFEAYCEELNLNPAEAIRYLILEELERKQKTGDNKRNQMLSPVNTEKTNATKGIPVDSKKLTTVSEKLTIDNSPKMGKRKYMSQFRIGNHYPCPICNKWIHTDHFSNRHAKVHTGLPSDEFLRKYEKEALTMVRQRRNED